MLSAIDDEDYHRYGEHYWMVDMTMDCDQTEGGWFEVKSFITNAGSGWEGDITQVSTVFQEVMVDEIGCINRMNVDGTTNS